MKREKKMRSVSQTGHEFGEFLRQKRRRMGLTIEDMTVLINLSQFRDRVAKLSSGESRDEIVSYIDELIGRIQRKETKLSLKQYQEAIRELYR